MSPRRAGPRGLRRGRWALRAFPAEFRRRFGTEMEDDLRRVLARPGARPWAVAARLVREGVAARLERRRSGGAAGTEGTRSGGVGMAFEALRQDTGFAIRALMRRPGFALVAIGTIGLGIGANTAIFSVVDGVLLRPLPFPEPERLVRIGSFEEGNFGTLGTISNPEMEAMEGLSSFASVVAFRTSEYTLTGMGPAEVVPTARVTRGLFETLGIPPRLGRDFRAEEAADPATRLVVISDRFWRARFAGSPDVLGRTLTLDGESYEVIGVAEAGAEWPERVELWVAGGTVEGDCWWGCSLFYGLARLESGGSVAVAQQELDALAIALEEAQPNSQTDRVFLSQTLHGHLVSGVRDPLWILLGAVGMVLLIACVNVAQLLLARGSSRRGEFAVRSALGASRGRLMTSVLAESVVIALTGAAVGIGIARGTIALLPRLSDGTIPRLDEVGLHPTVLLFTLGIAGASALFFGVVPGIRAARGAGLADGVRETGRGGTARRGPQSLLLAGEVAISLVLLVGAGLLLRSFGMLTATDLGLRTENVTRFDVGLPDVGYEEAEAVIAFVDGLEARLAALPGVTGVSTAVGAPMSAYSIGGSIRFTDRPAPPPGEGANAAVRVATPGHFDLYDIEVVRGRAFDHTDVRGTPTAYVVNEAFVRAWFAEGDDPIGEPIRMGISFGYGREPGRIVGVVEDVGTVGIGWEIEPEIYVPHEQLVAGFFTVSVGTNGEPVPARAISEALAALDPDVPYFRLNQIEESFAEGTASTRFYLSLLGGFALVALVMAAVGLYGVIAYSVSRRTREIGLRSALGADRGEIVGMVIRQGMAPTILGVLLGLALALAGSRLLRSILYGVEPIDPLTFAAVPVLLVAVAAGAILVPARRAAQVEPVEALRAE